MRANTRGRIAEECQADAVERVRRQIINSFFLDGDPDLTYREESIA